MESNDPQLIPLENLKPGQTVKIVNRTNTAQKYTFDCEEYGKISFDLIIGATVNFTVGTTAPKIIIDKTDQ